VDDGEIASDGVLPEAASQEARQEMGVNIGEQLRTIREQKHLSQGDIEKSTGLLRCYVSRVENGHTVPAIETLEKFARALDVSMHELFYEGENPPELNLLKGRQKKGWGSAGADARLFDKFRRLLSRIDRADRDILFATAKILLRRKSH
jgi:transcriptional regulator with XRE-family HTH domain